MRATLNNMTGALIAYGPWGIFALAIIDSMGVPLPAAIDALLILTAASNAHSPKAAYSAALLAVMGSVAGNIALFLAASHGRRLMIKSEPAAKRQRFRDWFHGYGLLTVFVPAVVPLVPLPLKVFVISAGAFHTPLARFLVVIVIARVIRYFALAYLGLQLGLDAQGFLLRNGWTLTGAALLVSLLAVLVIRANEKRRAPVP